MSAHGASSASTPSRMSRRSTPRVTSACRMCKQRRAKCDGARPKCESCIQHALECSYEGVDLRKVRHTTVEFNALTARIAYLEQRVRTLEASQKKGQLAEPSESSWSEPPALISAAASPVGVPGFPEAAESSDLADLADLGASTSSDPAFPLLLAGYDDLGWPGSDLQLLPPVLDSADEQTNPMTMAMVSEQDKVAQVLDNLTARVAQLQLDQKSGTTYFVGPTSNLHLLRGDGQAASAPTDLGREPDQTLTPTTPTTALTAYEGHLIQVFRDAVHPTFRLFQDADVMRPKWPDLLLSIVLAVASFFARDGAEDDDAHRARVMDHYMARFTSLLGHEVDHHCLDNVKAFLLRAYLAILEGRLESATIFNSMACAMAKRMGLHADGPTWQSENAIVSAQERQERLATFWACIWLDRRLAILEGRACHIDYADISTPLPLGGIQAATDNYGELSLSLDLVYACHIDFFYIQDIILSKIYGFSQVSAKEDATSEGYLRASTWFASLPASMKDISKGKGFHESFTAFHMCFHAGVVLLHRASMRGEGRGAELANRRCQASAAKITALLKSYVAVSDVFFPPADPMVIHAGFTAALVHMVLLLYPDIFTFRSSLAALRSTVGILSRFAVQSPYAALALQDLRGFAMKWSISPANSPHFWKQPGEDRVLP